MARWARADIKPLSLGTEINGAVCGGGNRGGGLLEVKVGSKVGSKRGEEKDNEFKANTSPDRRMGT